MQGGISWILQIVQAMAKIVLARLAWDHTNTVSFIVVENIA